MKVKTKKTKFEIGRVIVRWFGVICGLIPVISYFTFAYTFDRIKYRPNYETFELEVTKNSNYHISQIALELANATWISLLPLSLLIALVDIIIALRKQLR